MKPISRGFAKFWDERIKNFQHLWPNLIIYGDYPFSISSYYHRCHDEISGVTHIYQVWLWNCNRLVFKWYGGKAREKWKATVCRRDSSTYFRFTILICKNGNYFRTLSWIIKYTHSINRFTSCFQLQEHVQEQIHRTALISHMQPICSVPW